MAKKQSFGDKVAQKKKEAKRMAKVVMAEQKSNGQIRFRDKMVNLEGVQEEIRAARG